MTAPMAEPLVLLVDDSPLVTEALGILLVETGHRVVTAGSVREAIDAARAERPDVLLLDLTLPDGDGLEVLRALTADGAAPRATVALTGHDDALTEARCLAAGCRAVMSKPVPAAALLRGLREWTAGAA
ncbi:response regulator [Roseisolibacter sp. H3M3-2]|uniref:response regulator n=1 Tax=Roseisolibacter sp. H3M3-2 TaxID=3031323 RepID=UPI0023DA110E|nr:response regulator [Roseisolibacter sp. H3M3-2]MDF1502140.1 response regulator [Roseisolibacter sp. H3M3-2]